jgi:hypothetical protein
MALKRRMRVDVGHVSAEALKSAAAYAAKRELVRVETKGDSLFLFVGSLAVRTFSKSPENEKLANILALALCGELDSEFQRRALWVGKESRYREVKHY